MNDSLRGLLTEYCASLAQIRKSINQAKKNGSEKDIATLSAMERELQWNIEYMATGFPPAASGRRTIPVDPQKVLIWFTSPHSAPTLSIERVRVQILSALDVLSRQEREAFLMIVGEGLSYAEVAQMMRVGKSTVQSYVERAKAKISERRKILAVRSAYKGERNISA